jgi:hypothetical protein
MARREPEEVHSITSAREPYSSQVDHRERNYLISMAVRVACFIGFVAVDHWSRWILLVGAVFLPYVAVVIGNSAIRNPGDGPSPFGVDRKQLDQ